MKWSSSRRRPIAPGFRSPSSPTPICWPRTRPQLDELARRPRVRGVRMQLHWHENLLYRFASGPELARDERLKANVARLGQYGWSVRPAGLRIPDGRRRRARRRLPGRDLRPPACRDAGGSLEEGVPPGAKA